MNPQNERFFEEKMERFRPYISNSDNFDLVEASMHEDLAVGRRVELTYRGRGNGEVQAEKYIFVYESGRYRLFNYEFDERIPEF